VAAVPGGFGVAGTAATAWAQEIGDRAPQFAETPHPSVTKAKDVIDYVRRDSVNGSSKDSVHTSGYGQNRKRPLYDPTPL
jgi:hypothetical protein